MKNKKFTLAVCIALIFAFISASEAFFSLRDRFPKFEFYRIRIKKKLPKSKPKLKHKLYYPSKTYSSLFNRSGQK